MSYFDSVDVNNTISIQAGDSFTIDPFGSQRVSQRTTLFASKQLHDKNPLFFDEETSGGTETSAHSVTDASVTMTVNLNNEYVVRQSNQRLDYQPGKGQRILVTFVMGATTANVIKRVGYFNSSSVAPYTASYDGIYLEDDGTGLFICQAKSGTVTRVAQANWNVDTFDGDADEFNPSGVTLDITKAQIFFIDFEWLGVGRVRCGFVVDGKIYYANYFNNANVVTSVYMSSPNHSIRYEIRSTGGTGSMQHICSTVESEGGVELGGIVRSYNTGFTPIDAGSAGTLYALIGMRLKSTHLDSSIVVTGLSFLCASGSNFLWEAYVNPSVAGTFTYTPITNSALEIAIGDQAADPSTSVVTNGTRLASGYVSANADSIDTNLPTNLRLGAAIDGTRDSIVFCVSQISGANEDFFGSVTWRES